MNLTQKQENYLTHKLIDLGTKNRPQAYWDWFETRDELGAKETISRLSNFEASMLIGLLMHEEWEEALRIFDELMKEKFQQFKAEELGN